MFDCSFINLPEDKFIKINRAFKDALLYLIKFSKVQ